MSRAETIDWLPLFPPLHGRSLEAVTRNLEQMSEHLHGPKAPSMHMLWNNLTHYLKGPTNAALIEAGHDVAKRIDQGIGAGEGNGYHNAVHFKEVLVCAAALVRISAWQGRSLSAREQAILLFSAMAHDYDHDGGKNGMTPLRLENSSLRGIAGDLKRHNVDKVTSDAVHLMVRSTDVSRSPDYVNTLKAGGRMPVPEGYGALAPLGDIKNKRIAELAAMLRDADILLAAGITGHTAKVSKAKLGTEWNKVLDYKDHLGLLNFVVSQPDGLGGRNIGFASEAGKFFNPNIAVVTHSLAQLLRPAPAGAKLQS